MPEARQDALIRQLQGALTDQLAGQLTLAPHPVGLLFDCTIDAAGSGALGNAGYHMRGGINCINGVNGPRGGTAGTHNDWINTDTDGAKADYANSTDFSFFGGMFMAETFATKGSFQGHIVNVISSDDGGTNTGYQEAFGYYGSMQSDCKGALTGMAEFSNHVMAGKQARASVINLILNEENAQSTYPTALGSTSQWARGARAIDLISGGAQPAGVGINFRGAWKRPLLYDTGGGQGVVINDAGYVDISRVVGTGAAGLRIFTRWGQGDSGGTPDVLAVGNPALEIRTDMLRFADATTNPTPVADVTLGRGGASQIDITGKLKVTAAVGFNNNTPVGKQTVSGAKGGNAALGSLLNALVAFGLITDSTTA